MTATQAFDGSLRWRGRFALALLLVVAGALALAPARAGAMDNNGDCGGAVCVTDDGDYGAGGGGGYGDVGGGDVGGGYVGDGGGDDTSAGPSAGGFTDPDSGHWIPNDPNLDAVPDGATPDGGDYSDIPDSWDGGTAVPTEPPSDAGNPYFNSDAPEPYVEDPQVAEIERQAVLDAGHVIYDPDRTPVWERPDYHQDSSGNWVKNGGSSTTTPAPVTAPKATTPGVKRAAPAPAKALVGASRAVAPVTGAKAKAPVKKAKKVKKAKQHATRR
jgi:hypothetical protein